MTQNCSSIHRGLSSGVALDWFVCVWRSFTSICIKTSVERVLRVCLGAVNGLREPKMSVETNSVPAFHNAATPYSAEVLKASGPVHAGWWDCCGCSTMYRFSYMTDRHLQLDQWLKANLPQVRPGMCLAILNEAEFQSFGHVFERNKFRVIGDVVRNGPSGSLLYTLCFYKRETEQERATRSSAKKSIVGAK